MSVLRWSPLASLEGTLNFGRVVGLSDYIIEAAKQRQRQSSRSTTADN